MAHVTKLVKLPVQPQSGIKIDLPPHKIVVRPAPDIAEDIIADKLDTDALYHAVNAKWPTSKGGPLPDLLQYIIRNISKYSSIASLPYSSRCCQVTEASHIQL
jgi:hypothetical protein